MRDHRGRRRAGQRFKWRLPPQRPPSAFAASARRAYLLRAVAWGLVSALAYAGAYIACRELLDALKMIRHPAAIALWTATPMAVVVWLMIAVALTYPFAIAIAVGMYPLVVRRSWLAVIAAYGRCPACGYDIANIEPDPDGLTVCPECGGAWRVKEPDA